MRRKLHLLLCGGLLPLFLLAVPGFGQDASEVLTNEDVIRLSKASLPASVIIAKIGSSRTDFDSSVDALVALAEAEVDSEIIEAMTNAGVQAASPAGGNLDVVVGRRASAVANVASNFAGTPCVSPGIFLSEQGTMVDLELTQPTSTKTGSGILSGLTYGIKSTKAKAMIGGVRSHVRTTERSPTFYFCFEEAQAGLSYQTTGAVNPSEFVLIAFDVLKKKEQRSFVTGKLNLWTGASGGSPPKQLRQVEYRKRVPGVYEVTSEALDPGEYAFYYGGQATLMGFFGAAFGGGAGKVFAFGVD